MWTRTRRRGRRKRRMRTLHWPRRSSLSVWRHRCRKRHSAIRHHLHCHRSHRAIRHHLHCQRSRCAVRLHLHCQRSRCAVGPHLHCQRSRHTVRPHLHCQRSHSSFPRHFHFHWSSDQLWQWCQMWMVCSSCILFVCLSYCPYIDLMKFMASSCSSSRSHGRNKKAMHGSWLFPQFGWPFGQLAQ